MSVNKPTESGSSISDKEQIMRINNTFYRALGSRDLDLMGTIWIKDQRAGCVHPGWIMLQGWEAIRQSWENVFDPEDRLEIKLHNLSVDIKGNAAWVTCVQELKYIMRDPVSMNISTSTNIFEKTDEGWKMVVHHASPLPVTFDEIADDNIQ